MLLTLLILFQNSMVFAATSVHEKLPDTSSYIFLIITTLFYRRQNPGVFLVFPILLRLTTVSAK